MSAFEEIADLASLVVEGRPEWMDRGECIGLSADFFHPRRGQPTEPAKAICAGCPVQKDCLEYALVNFLKVGVWGGTSERERRLIRRERRTAARLGVSLKDAKVLVAREITATIAARSANRPLVRLIRKYGYTREEAEIILARHQRQTARSRIRAAA